MELITLMIDLIILEKNVSDFITEIF